MTIELNQQQQQLIDMAIRSGACHNPEEVIDTALSMLAENIEEGQISMKPKENRQQTGQALIDASAKIRGLLSDQEVDELFVRNPSPGRPVDFE